MAVRPVPAAVPLEARSLRQATRLEIVRGIAPVRFVTVVHKIPSGSDRRAGTFFEVFTFDTFRVRNGKLVEHWDGAVIIPTGSSSCSGRSTGWQRQQPLTVTRCPTATSSSSPRRHELTHRRVR